MADPKREREEERLANLQRAKQESRLIAVEGLSEWSWEEMAGLTLEEQRAAIGRLAVAGVKAAARAGDWAQYRQMLMWVAELAKPSAKPGSSDWVGGKAGKKGGSANSAGSVPT